MTGKNLLIANVVGLLALAAALFVPDFGSSTLIPTETQQSGILAPIGKALGSRPQALGLQKGQLSSDGTTIPPTTVEQSL